MEPRLGLVRTSPLTGADAPSVLVGQGKSVLVSFLTVGFGSRRHGQGGGGAWTEDAAQSPGLCSTGQPSAVQTTRGLVGRSRAPLPPPAPPPPVLGQQLPVAPEGPPSQQQRKAAGAQGPLSSTAAGRSLPLRSRSSFF